jgi:hypothetical protein
MTVTLSWHHVTYQDTMIPWYRCHAIMIITISFDVQKQKYTAVEGTSVPHCTNERLSGSRK